MWKSFPDRAKHPKLIDLHTHIGGALARNIHTPGFGPEGNTCAVRISYALNHGGAPVSKDIASKLKISTLTGGDGFLYIFRVREIKTYLSAALGPADKVATTDFMNAFKALRGIVSFDVQGWSDASGHVALWDGTQFKEAGDDYRHLRDNPATPLREATTTRMSLWKL